MAQNRIINTMDFFHKNKNIILILVLLACGFYFYSTYFKPDSQIVVTPDDLTAQAVGAEVIELQSKITSVNLKQGLFTSSLYNKLIDFSVPILEQPRGRSNPFSPVGFD